MQVGPTPLDHPRPVAMPVSLTMAWHAELRYKARMTTAIVTQMWLAPHKRGGVHLDSRRAVPAGFAFVPSVLCRGVPSVRRLGWFACGFRPASCPSLLLPPDRETLRSASLLLARLRLLKGGVAGWGGLLWSLKITMHWSSSRRWVYVVAVVVWWLFGCCDVVLS